MTTEKELSIDDLICNRCGNNADFNKSGGNCPECGDDLCIECAGSWSETANDDDPGCAICDACYLKQSICLEHTVKGNKYTFTIVANNKDDTEGIFEIHAKCLQSGKTSCVTNNNSVIAWFIHPIFENEEVEGSTFIVTDRSKFRELVDRATKLLEDRYWVRKYLEPAMDNDRAAGEWECETEKSDYADPCESCPHHGETTCSNCQFGGLGKR